MCLIVTYDPASFISGHVTVDLHTLAGVSIDVNSVDTAECLSVQQVLGTILGSGKNTTPWKDDDKQVIFSFWKYYKNNTKLH